MRREPVETSQAPRAIGPYTQAIRADGVVYTSGQIGLDPATGALVPGGIEAQTRRVLENLKAVLAAAGSSFDGVLRVTVYLTDLSHFPVMNRIFAEYLDTARPARSTVGVAALPMGALVEMDMIALCG
ncbi:MAG: RidA family protein [candidate division NC10 bacterium]|nr:RidA family protein [candidate division NC10 bacterium]